jgi:hypothetical protein
MGDWSASTDAAARHPVIEGDPAPTDDGSAGNARRGEDPSPDHDKESTRDPQGQRRLSAPDRTAPHNDKPQILRQRIVVDLSRKETIWTIPGTSHDDQAQLTNIKVSHLPTSFILIPKKGVVRLGHPVDIVLSDPSRVRIRLALTRRKGELAAKISPQIKLAGGDCVDFTEERVERAIRSFDRQIGYFTRRLSVARREHRRIELWLSSPGNKPLQLVKGADLKLEVLEGEIADGLRRLPMARSHYAAMIRLAQLANRIHESTEIQFAAEVFPQN